MLFYSLASDENMGYARKNLDNSSICRTIFMQISNNVTNWTLSSSRKISASRSKGRELFKKFIGGYFLFPQSVYILYILHI